ncbi:MAG: hypothetical protein SPK50_07235 [Mobiluncus porci]|uniref:Uncharacterized protein n=1 Tax=Mobiluncus porci TaxID=2652278 RepID=A0A7K0K270_9ACTO|nr:MULTISPECIES: hypothetical protein [Mobiluncus]MCI6583496.1 hypothetical protein [Mobiluncus sp.]MDD7540874.1 hypothetical protein [Mobiluncus porci]MDY5748903.1 hypothetical protein [Mobiluncus porci]MST49160.1 hypothetical protein [Mobiluncus porci]
MNENENQPQDLPDYLRQEAQNSSGTSENPAVAADPATPAADNQYLEPVAPETPETPETPEAPEAGAPTEPANQSAMEDTSTQAWTTFLSETDDTPRAKVVSSEQTALVENKAEPEPALAEPETATVEPEPALAETTDTVTPTVAESSPTPYLSETSTTSTTQPEENSELETTVVRRKSLLGGETTETHAPVKPVDAQDAEPQWQPRQAQLLGNDDQSLNEATVLAGASIKPAKISRAGAHAASLVLSLLALPFAWAFLKHASGMLYGGANSAWEQGAYSVEGLVYLGLGLALLVVVGLAVRLSSLGMFVGGILLTAIGLAFVAAPFLMQELAGPTLTWLSESTIIAFRNLSYFLESSAFSGQFLVIGVVMLMVGVIGHTARRRGRTDQIADKALAKAEARP